MRPIQNNTGTPPPGGGPLSTKDANADQATSKADDTNSVKRRAPRTRVPPAVRAKEKLAHDAKLTSVTAATTTLKHDLSNTEPSIANRDSDATDIARIRKCIFWLGRGVSHQDMDKIETILKHFRKEKLRFDREPVVSLWPDMKKKLSDLMLVIVKFSAESPAYAPQVTRILIDMINMGCDPTGRTRHDNTLLTLAASYGMTKLVDFLLRACPELDKHALNIAGKNAAMWAQSHGHADALRLLLQAGVKLHPSNPALNFYKANLKRFAGEDAEAAYSHLSTLLQDTHLINLPDETGKTMIFHAVLKQDVQTVHFLCKQEDFPDLTRRDQDGKSVFDYVDEISDADIFDAMNPVLEKLFMETTEER